MSARQADTEFLRLGVQYYVAARGAAISGLLPVCGNLYHHALEMFLKGGLSQKYSLKGLKNKFGHRLIDMWSAFRLHFSSSGSLQFDTTIADIAEFEDVRYPDQILKHGAEMIIDWGLTPTRSSEQSPIPMYTLNVTNIDYLIAEIFRASSQAPLKYTMSLKPDVRAILARDNPAADQIIG